MSLLFEDLLNHCDIKDVMKSLEDLNKINETPLHEACRSGDTFLIEKIKNAYVKHNSLVTFFSAITEMQTKDVKKAPFHVACRGRRVEMIEKLFEIFNDKQFFSDLLNLKDREQSLPLHYASELENSKIAEVLISHETEITSNESGKNPLHIAARFGRIDVATLLLSFKGDVLINEEDIFFETPLFHAVRYKKKEFVEFLLQK